jgi:hypothetical protein
MPNWVDNKLEIIGDTEHVQEVVEAIKGEPDENGKPSKIDFDKILKMPEELSNNEGYHWCCENWGTNKYYNSDDEDDPKNEIHFRTAWVPALPIMMKLSSSFERVSLRLSYWDVPRGREGMFLIKNGQVVEDLYSDMELTIN